MGKNVLQRELSIYEENQLKKTANNELCFNFALRLRRCLIESNMTQEELSEKINNLASPSSVTQYLKGKQEPKIGTVLAMSRVFKVSIDYLLGTTKTKSMNKDVKTVYGKMGLNESAIKNILYLSQISSKQLKTNANIISYTEIASALLSSKYIYLLSNIHRYINYTVDANKEFELTDKGHLIHVPKKGKLVDLKLPEVYPSNLLEEIYLKNIIRDMEELKKNLICEKEKQIADTLKKQAMPQAKFKPLYTKDDKGGDNK